MKIDSKKIVSKYLEYMKRKEKNNEKPLLPGQWLWHVMDSLKVEELLEDTEELPREERGHMFWREKPLGSGESSVIIIPFDEQAENAISEHFKILCQIFRSTTDSEETVKFRIEELDR